MQEDTQNTGRIASDADTKTSPAITPHPTPEVPHKPGTSVTPTPAAVISEVTAPEVAAAVATLATSPSVVAAPTESKKTITEEIAELESLLPGLEARRFDVEEKSKEYFSKRKDLELTLSPVLQKENASLLRIHEIEEKEKSAMSPADRRILDKQRWEAEEERHNIEEEKWPIAEQLESVTHEIKESEHSFMALMSEEAEVRAKIKQLNILSEQNALHAQLEKVTGEKSTTLTDLAALRAEHERLSQLIRDTQKQETVVMGAEHIVDSKVGGAGSLYEERVLAEERHKLEAARRMAEEARWKAEDAIVTVTKSEEENAAQLQAISEKESDIKAKIARLG